MSKLATLPIERVVTILTPLFAAASGWLTGWIGSNFPGLPALPAGDVTALEIAGFTGAAAAVVHWLHGRQKFVAFTDEAKQELDHAMAQVKDALAHDPQAQLQLSDMEKLLEEHQAAIEQGLESHVPKVVAQSLGALFAQLGQAPAAPAAAQAPPAPAAPDQLQPVPPPPAA